MNGYWPRNVPETAQRLKYFPLNGREADYFLWMKNGKWYWHALGNNGSQETKDMASERCKRWIRDRQ